MPWMRLDHAQLPVPVGVRAVDDLGQVDVAQHRAEAAGVRPVAVDVLDDLGGLRPRRRGPRGLQRRVAVGVVADRRRPGVHQLDRLLGVAVVAGDVPEQCVGVRRDRVLTLVRAAVVRVRVRAALDHRARFRRTAKGAVRAVLRLVEGVGPRLRAGLHLGPDEVELRPADPTPGWVNVAGASADCDEAAAGLLRVPATSAAQAAARTKGIFRMGGVLSSGAVGQRFPHRSFTTPMPTVKTTPVRNFPGTQGPSVPFPMEQKAFPSH